MDRLCYEVLNNCTSTPVLIDLGASAGPPAIWTGIAPACVYVAFEPDPRSNAGPFDHGFKQTVAIRAAATAVEQETVRLYLTRSRFCSSTLPPAAQELRKFVFAPLFDVERTEDLAATTIARALQAHQIDRVHWFKADTQGTDLRLFQSIAPQMRAGILAVDIEPGLINAYEGEDFFAEAHTYLTANGFWLSSLSPGINARGARSTLAQMLGDPAADVERVPPRYRYTPVCCEARYLRELVPGEMTRDDLATLAAFAVMDQQPIFAFEAIEAIPADARGPALQALAAACVAAVRAEPPPPTGLWSRLARRMGV